MKTHELKILPQYFRDVRAGRKTAEIRFDDRDYMIGDRLVLKEWKPRKKVFTHHEIPVKVVGMTRLNHVIPDGNLGRWVVMYFEIECA